MSRDLFIGISRWSLVIAALLCCVGVADGQSASQRSVQRFEREPEDQTAVVGETVVMACRVINKAGVLQWTKDDFGLGSDRNLSGFERYSMIGSEDEGKGATSVLFGFLKAPFLKISTLPSFSYHEGVALSVVDLLYREIVRQGRNFCTFILT